MVLCRWICRSRVVGTARSVCNFSSSAVSSCKSPSPSPLPLISLAPVVAGDNKIYRLRSLAADSSVIEVNTKRLAGDAEAELVGLSHGWVAMFNKRNNSLYLSDPLSHRRINLPPYHTLPDPIFSTDYGSVSKVVLSSSPDDNDCRAVMIFGLGKRLAFCLPRRSSEWTPIGKPFIDRTDDCYRFVRFARIHDDLVYCTRRKVFTSVSPCHFDYSAFQLWDRRVVSQDNFYVIRSQIHRWDWDTKKLRFHSRHSKLIALPEHEHKLKGGGGGGGGGGGATRMWLELNQHFLQERCIHIPHIVYAEHSNQQFIVLRYVRLIGVEDGDGIPYCPEKGLEKVFECQTCGFLVLEINVRGQFELVEDLNGMAMFVGMDTSFAIPAEAAAANELKANSIYFTDAKRSRMLCGVNDNGVFDYQNKTISPFLL